MTHDAYSENRCLATVVAHTPKGLQVAVKGQQAGCKRCEQGVGCGAGLFARRQQWLIEVSVPGHPGVLAEPGSLSSEALFDDDDAEYGADIYPLGSEVVVGLPAISLSIISLCVYTIPLLMALMASGAVSLYGFPYLPSWSAPALFFVALITTLVALRYTLPNAIEHLRPRLLS